MPVDKFGRTNVVTSQRVVSGGVTLSQANNTFLKRDGENTATGNMDLDSHKLVNVLEPSDAQDAATKNYVDGRTFLPFKKFLSPCATGLNTYVWTDSQSIPAVFSESEFDELPAGFYGCYSGHLPATRLGSLPANTKGYLTALTYQQPADRNKYYKWINSTNIEEWTAYFKQGTWNTWVKSGNVSKAGDTMTGDLSLSVGADLLRTLGCSDLSGSKGFAVLLGSVMNQIQCQLNQPIAILATDGLLCKQGNTNIIRFGKAVGDLRTDVYQDIVMNQKYIVDLHDPNSAQDAATKNYADNLTKKSYSGYIPILEANASRLGFTASASTVAVGNFQPYGAFNSLNADGSNGCWVTLLGFTTGWLQIKCPEAVTIWRVALKARPPTLGKKITAWNIAASNDGINFTTLLTSTAALSGAATAPSFFSIPTTTAYQYYRFNITASTGFADVGVQVMQLYVLTD